MKEWAWVAILAILSFVGFKVGGLAKDKGKHEAEDKAIEREGERADELAKRLSDGHDINSHFGMLDNGEDKDTESAPRFEVSHSDRSSD